MDVAKYLLTGVLLASMVSDLQDMKWLVYVIGFFATLLSLGLGLAMLKDTEKTKNKGGFDYADCRMVIYSICSFCNSCIYLEPNR